jgi:glycosyltransferase involved in cell wall biosynthesis
MGFDTALSDRKKSLMARIAFVVPDLRGGGAERVAVTLVNDLVRRGHDVDLLVMKRTGELFGLVDQKVRVIDLKAPRARNVPAPLARYLRQERPDVMQLSMWPLTVVGILAGCLSGSKTRIVVSDHAVLSNHVPHSVQPFLRLTTRAFYPRADARVTVSHGAARDLAAISGLPESSFTVITNPIEFPTKLEREEAVDALWGGASKRILTVGHLKEVKNQAFLIRAFSKLPPRLGAKFMILGTGPLESELKRDAAELGLEDRVIFPGYAVDPWPFYASANLFVLGSDEESFGNVLVEAQFAGLPVVSTINTGASEVLGGGEFGTLVPRGDVEGFAKAMEEALRGDESKSGGKERAVAISGARSLDRYESLLLGSLAA